MKNHSAIRRIAQPQIISVLPGFGATQQARNHPFPRSGNEWWACRKTGHCEPVRFPGVAISQLFRPEIDRFNLKTGGFPRQCAHWLGMTLTFLTHWPLIPAKAEMSGFHLLYPQRRSFPLLRGIQTLLSVQRAGSLILITINLKAIRRNCRNIELLIGFILVTFRS